MVRVHSDAPISFLAHFIPVQPRAGAANSLNTSKLTSSPRVPGKAEWHMTFFIRPGKALTTSKMELEAVLVQQQETVTAFAT